MKLMGRHDGYDKSVSDGDTTEASNVSLGQILNQRRAIVYSSDTTNCSQETIRKEEEICLHWTLSFLG
jgi:hypothetical protein